MTLMSEALSAAKKPSLTPCAQDWLHTQLSRMRRDGEFSIINVKLFGELAIELLKLNTKNRKFKENQMPALCAATLEGRWVNTGHPIVISSDGQLQDGQHRLTAVTRTGASITADFRFGIDPRAFAVTDIGSKRTGGDTLQIAGYQQHNILASTARLLIAFENDIAKLHILSNDVCLQFVEEHPLLVDAARIGHSTASAIKTTPTACAAAAFIISTARGVAEAEAFFTELRAGGGLGFAKPTMPMPRLRAAIDEGRFTNPRAMVAAFILAFNAHAAGRSVRNREALSLIAGEPFPSVMYRPRP
jgi:hypothetical protein